MNPRKFFGLLLIAAVSCTCRAQVNEGAEQRLVAPGVSFFVPHWYVKAQVGGAYDLGEAKFTQLVSPALQLAVGYKFNEMIGLRGSLSGLWARNRYAFPEARYQWNFVQPALEAEVDLTQLVLGRKPDRRWSVYAVAGGGVAFAFNNDDAVEADKRYGIDFQKLWKHNRWNPVARGGLGVDYRVMDELSIGAEVNANMLPDHFNSKRGKHDNRDWHFNALLGLKFNIGRSHGRTEPEYETVLPPKPVEPAVTKDEHTQFVDVPVEQISFNVNIQFLINQSVIRANQIPKLTALLKYLGDHPKAFIRLSGYADRETGNPTINMRLSRERAQVVSQYLQDAGIAEWRIRRFAKGDTVQPFDLPEDNRVCICFVYDPENPVPQVFEY